MSRYELKARGSNDVRAELRIYGDIGQSWDAEESIDARTVSGQLGELTGDLDVRINSFGGSVADGLAIFNALRRYNGKVTTHIDGVAYSIASLIAMAGEEIHMAANAMLMIHAPWGMAMGNAPELREMADVLDKHAEAMLASYLREGGPDAATIRGWLTDGKDHYFSASEAVAQGLVDVVSDAAPLMDIAAALRETDFLQPAARAAHQPEADMDLTKDQGGPAADILASHSKTVNAARDQGIQAEAKRRKAISNVFAQFYDGDAMNPVTALHDACMDDVKCDELEARRKLMALLAQKSADPILASEHYGMDSHVATPPRASHYLGGANLRGDDGSQRRTQGLTAALRIKAGLETDRNKIEKEREGEFLAMSLTDLMARELRASGYTVAGTREDIARRYVNAMPILAAGPSHGTDHLPAILGNIANLSAMQGWESSEETWSQWTQAGQLNNYQTATRANAALLDKLTKMLENQEWEYGDMKDVKQRITGYLYGLKYSLSLQAIVNDDLGELARTMQGWGEAAAATVGDVVYATLVTSGAGGLGQVMDEDSKVLFHADHSNYIASGVGAAPSETTLNTARASMMQQTDPNGRKVAVRPRHIIHGPSLYSTVRKVLNSEQLQEIDVGTSTTISSGLNSGVRDMNLNPVEEYRLTGVAWLLAAARRTIEVAGVGGPVTPRAAQSLVSNTPGITYELSMPFGVAALDYRGMYYNAGA